MVLEDKSNVWGFIKQEKIRPKRNFTCPTQFLPEKSDIKERVNYKF